MCEDPLEIAAELMQMLTAGVSNQSAMLCMLMAVVDNNFVVEHGDGNTRILMNHQHKICCSSACTHCQEILCQVIFIMYPNNTRW